MRFLKNKAVILLIILTHFAFLYCKNDKKESKTFGNTELANPLVGGSVDTIEVLPNVDAQAIVTPKVGDAKIKNFTIVPKQQVGQMTVNMTEADLKKLYGDSNVVRVDRGDVKTVIFPKSPNEIEIAWRKNHDFKKLETAIIHGGGWKSPEGIGVGMSLDELTRINGKPIDLFQMEDGIASVRWQGGAVNPNLKVLVDTDTKKVIEIQVDF